jgi:TfoX/Sxy family transcriptional regulator of competence genes
MGTHKDAAGYILRRLGHEGRFSVKAMFGEYALYADGRVVGLICDDQLFVKVLPESASLAGRCELAPAYPGSRDHYLVPEEMLAADGQLAAMLLRVAQVLPLPKGRPSSRKK